MRKYFKIFFRNHLKSIFSLLAITKNNNFEIKYIAVQPKSNLPIASSKNEIYLPIDEYIAPHILKHGKWDYNLIKFISRHHKKNSVFFDIGANIGQITMQLIQKKVGIKKYFCFEPDDQIFNILKKNINNKYSYLFNFGVGIRNEKKILYVNRLNKSDNTFEGEKKTISMYPKYAYIKNINTIFKKIINKEKISNIIFKSDTQGMDEEILLSIQKKYLNKIHLLIIEISNFQFLKKNKYNFIKVLSKFDYFYDYNLKKINISILEKKIKEEKEFVILLKKK